MTPLSRAGAGFENLGPSLPRPTAENGPLAWSSSEAVVSTPRGKARRQAQPDPIGAYHTDAGGAGAFRASAYQMLFSLFVLEVPDFYLHLVYNLVEEP